MKQDTKTILVIEDEPALLQALADKLTREGFEVYKAKDGDEGLKLALRKHPDLILLDLVLPKMDGIAVLRELRADVWGKEVPVLLLTNVNESGKVAEAVTLGVNDYLVKAEWRIEDIVKKIKQRLGMIS